MTASPQACLAWTFENLFPNVLRTRHYACHDVANLGQGTQRKPAKGLTGPPTELEAQKQANAWKASEQGFRVLARVGPHNISCYSRIQEVAEGLPRKEEGSSQSP